MKKTSLQNIVAALIVLAFASCDRNRNTTGWQYFDDMVK